MMLDDTLLDTFAHTFYGYGSYNAPFWFIGMEEGGGGAEAEIARRIAVWDARGQQELEDLAEYHFAINVPRYFEAAAPLQPTWSKLIRLLLSAQRGTLGDSTIRAYQRGEWGRTNNETCLIELLPLPSPSTDHWLYAECSALPYLSTRDGYREEVGAWRGEHIRSRIAEHQPHAVIFYGTQYQPWWVMITESNFESDQDTRLQTTTNGSTRFLIVQHPTAYGSTNAYYEAAGALLR
jgi:hypothetical protein